jgi:hypothetical protein
MFFKSLLFDERRSSILALAFLPSLPMVQGERGMLADASKSDPIRRDSFTPPSHDRAEQLVRGWRTLTQGRDSLLMTIGGPFQAKSTLFNALTKAGIVAENDSLALTN